MRICMLLAEPYDPEMPARPFVMEISSELARRGHKILWVMPTREKTLMTRRHEGIRILALPCYLGDSLFGKILAKLILLMKEIKVVGRLKVDIVHVREDIAGGLAAYYLSRRFKMPYVFQYSFPFVDGVREKHRGLTMKIVSSVGNRILYFIMRHSDMVLPVSDQMKDELKEKGIAKERMAVVPLGVNVEMFYPDSCLPECMNQVVLYVGTLDREREMEILIRAFGLVKRKRANTKLLIVGSGEGEADLKKLVSDYGLNKEVVFTGRVPYSKVPSLISCASVCVSPVPPIPLYRSNSPSKMFEYMSMGKPVVANLGIYEHELVLVESGGGRLVPYHGLAFADAIIHLLDNPEKARAMGIAGRRWVVENRSYEIITERLERHYFGLLGEKA